jgi:hypothetical protein
MSNVPSLSCSNIHPHGQKRRKKRMPIETSLYFTIEYMIQYWMEEGDKDTKMKQTIGQREREIMYKVYMCV